jgi:hypothetical protein
MARNVDALIGRASGSTLLVRAGFARAAYCGGDGHGERGRMGSTARGSASPLTRETPGADFEFVRLVSPSRKPQTRDWHSLRIASQR